MCALSNSHLIITGHRCQKEDHQILWLNGTKRGQDLWNFVVSNCSVNVFMLWIMKCLDFVHVFTFLVNMKQRPWIHFPRVVWHWLLSLSHVVPSTPDYWTPGFCHLLTTCTDRASLSNKWQPHGKHVLTLLLINKSGLLIRRKNFRREFWNIKHTVKGLQSSKSFFTPPS